MWGEIGYRHVKAPVTGSRYQWTYFDLTHPTHKCINVTGEIRERDTEHHTGDHIYSCTSPTLFEQCVDSLASHRLLGTSQCETGPTVYRPCPRRLESLTVCRCHYKGSTFSSVIYFKRP